MACDGHIWKKVGEGAEKMAVDLPCPHLLPRLRMGGTLSFAHLPASARTPTERSEFANKQIGSGSKLKSQGYGVGPGFHLPGQPMLEFRFFCPTETNLSFPSGLEVSENKHKAANTWRFSRKQLRFPKTCAASLKTAILKDSYPEIYKHSCKKREG